MFSPTWLGNPTGLILQILQIEKKNTIIPWKPQQIVIQIMK
jgi:hypothetical protein